MNRGAQVLKAWIASHRVRKQAFDRLWLACGFGVPTVHRILAGEVLPDPAIGAELAEATGGKVTVDLFDLPPVRAERAA